MEKKYMVRLSQKERDTLTDVRKQLQPGERLRSALGKTVRITSIEIRAGPEPVYNLEVAGEHVYSITDSGLLVHNTGSCSVDEWIDVYHGTTSKEAADSIRNRINLSKSRENLDFGPQAFYTTRSESQALKWAGENGEVLHFRVRKGDLDQLGSTRTFADDGFEWQEFVTKNRLGLGYEFPNYDFVEGPVLANPTKIKSIMDTYLARGIKNHDQQAWLSNDAIKILQIVD